ncbi:MAG: HAD family hydrolase [bacterium]|nr:HAD family hydrolase [bacterium]
MDNTERKIIFFDVDGTLTDVDGNIPADAAEAVRRARERGNLCVINTGRPFLHLVDQIKALGFDAYICSCGGYILADGELLLHESFPGDFCRRAADYARKCRLNMYYESERGLCVDYRREIDGEIQEEMKRFLARGIPVETEATGEDFRFDKFCIRLKPDSDMAAFETFIAPYMDIIKRDEILRECVKKGISKATGIQLVTAHYGVPYENTYAIGDSQNDLLMLASVCHGIAMEEAPDNVKAAAEYVTAGLMSGGVAKALAHYDLC